MKKRTHTIILTLAIVSIALFSFSCGKKPTPKKVEKSPSTQAGQAFYAPFKPTDIILILDQSGSMAWTDPDNIRKQAAFFFIDNLGLATNKSLQARIGVVNFGTSAKTTLPLQTVTDPTLRQNAKSAILTEKLGGTDILESFKQSITMFNNAGTFDSQRSCAVVLFTDGEPDPYDKNDHENVPRYFEEIEGYVNGSVKDKCKVFVIGIDMQNKFWDHDRAYWENISSIPPIRINSVGDLNAAFHEVQANVLGYDWEELKTLVAGGSQIVELEPYLEKVNFIIFREADNTRLVITNPDNRVIGPGDKDIFYESEKEGVPYEIYSIPDPMPGKWKLEVIGTGRVKVYKDVIRFRTILLNPIVPAPLNAPLKFLFDVARSDSKEIKEIKGYPLRFGLGVTFPDETTKFVQFKRITGNIFEATDVISSDKIGPHKLAVDIKGGEKSIYYQEQTIQVAPLPYFEVESPSDLSSLSIHRDVPISLKFMFKGNCTLVGNFLKDDPESIGIIRVSTPSGKLLHESYMTHEKKNDCSRLTASIPAVDKVGKYIVQIRLNGKMIGNVDYNGYGMDYVATYKTNSVFKLSEYWWAFLALPLICWLVGFSSSFLRKRLEGRVNSDEDEIILKGSCMPFGVNLDSGISCEEEDAKRTILGRVYMIKKLEKVDEDETETRCYLRFHTYRNRVVGLVSAAIAAIALGAAVVYAWTYYYKTGYAVAAIVAALVGLFVFRHSLGICFCSKETVAEQESFKVEDVDFTYYHD